MIRGRNVWRYIRIADRPQPHTTHNQPTNQPTRPALRRLNADTKKRMSTDESKAGGSHLLPPCAICRAKVALYCCPRCHTRTCSLACCRAHKGGTSAAGAAGAAGATTTSTTSTCDGRRDRTRFSPLGRFTDSILASDYHFLEDVLKVTEGSGRLYRGIIAGGDPSASTSTTTGASRKRPRGTERRMGLDSICSSAEPASSAHPLVRAGEGKSAAEALLARGGVVVNDDGSTTHHQEERLSSSHHRDENNGIIDRLLLLANNEQPSAAAATPVMPLPPGGEKVDPLVRQAESKGIALLRMPCGMQRRQSNTTRFQKKTGVISWKIELCFHVPKSMLVDERGGGGSLLPKFLRVESELSESSTLSEELGKHLDIHPHNTATRSRLRWFANAPRDSLVLLMKRLPCSSASPKYFKLDPNAPLSESLKGKTIIEFPTIDVVADEEKGCYPLFIGEVS